MQSHRGLVQHVEHAHERGSDLRGQADSLSFAAAEGRRCTIERQVAQPHVNKKPQAARYRRDKRSGDRRFFSRKFFARPDFLQHGAQFCQRHTTQLTDVVAA